MTATHETRTLILKCNCSIRVDITMEFLKEPDITFLEYIAWCPVHRIGTLSLSEPDNDVGNPDTSGGDTWDDED
jgi:hypothetical protein